MLDLDPDKKTSDKMLALLMSRQKRLGGNSQLRDMPDEVIDSLMQASFPSQYMSYKMSLDSNLITNIMRIILDSRYWQLKYYPRGVCLGIDTDNLRLRDMLEEMLYSFRMPREMILPIASIAPGHIEMLQQTPDSEFHYSLPDFMKQYVTYITDILATYYDILSRCVWDDILKMFIDDTKQHANTAAWEEAVLLVEGPQHGVLSFLWKHDR